MPTAINPATEETSMAVGTAEVYLNNRPACSGVMEPPAIATAAASTGSRPAARSAGDGTTRSSGVTPVFSTLGPSRKRTPPLPDPLPHQAPAPPASRGRIPGDGAGPAGR